MKIYSEERKLYLKTQYCNKLWNDNNFTRDDLEYIAKELMRMLRQE